MDESVSVTEKSQGMRPTMVYLNVHDYFKYFELGKRVCFFLPSSLISCLFHSFCLLLLFTSKIS